jgi:hypothetical protein
LYREHSTYSSSEENAMSAPKIHTVVTHNRPHLDEIMALWLIYAFGAKILPGADTAKILFDGKGGELWQDRSPADLEKEGFVLLGVGGGRFDEHPGADVRRKHGKCCAELVAEFLGVHLDPNLRHLMKYVRETDLGPDSSHFALAGLVKKAHAAYPNDPIAVITHTMFYLEAEYRNQLAFSRALEWVKTEARIEEFEVQGGRGTLVMVVGQTDLENFGAAARYYHKDAAIVVQRTSSGNTQIYTNAKTGMNLRGVVVRLRQAEQKAAGQDVSADVELLGREGKIPDVPEWYYQPGAEFVLNGSLSCPDVPPTRIALERIVHIVKQGVK